MDYLSYSFLASGADFQKIAVSIRFEMTDTLFVFLMIRTGLKFLEEQGFVTIGQVVNNDGPVTGEVVVDPELEREIT